MRVIASTSANGHGRSPGFTLVELMVGLAISSFLLIGATTIFMQGRTAFRVNESVDRLQEDARFVLETMVPDIRMASYFGRQTVPSRIVGRATPDDPVPTGLAVTNDCGVNFTINVGLPVDADNNGYAWDCPPAEATQAGSDTLVVRRVEEDPDTVLDDGWLYVQSARAVNNQLFVAPDVPTGFLATNSQSFKLVVHGYFVSQTSDISTADNVVPSLRRWTLTTDGGAPALTEEEILPGVEDMQIQFGVDTDPVGSDNRGSVNRYVNPGDPILDTVANPDVEVIAVRLWLRIRAERRENGFTDDKSFVYADQNVAPKGDSYRRILVSKTIFMRNARTML